MNAIANVVNANNEMLTSVAAVVCGCALFYLVIARTIKRRKEAGDGAQRS